jgi:sec-independent protein translocase protein TatA
MFTGHWELLIVVFVALLLFGHRLPSVMRSLGRGVVEFKRGVQGVEDDLEEATSPKPVSHDKSSDDQAKT